MSKTPRLVRHCRLLVLPLALSFALAACGGDEAQQQMPSAAVTVVTLQAQQVTLSRELPGRTAPFLVAEVRPQVNGIVERQLFDEGGLVKAGEPLYQLEDAAYQADASSAKAGLARAEATLKSAQLTARRSAELAKIDAISKQDNENAIAALRQAEADVGVARAALQGRSVTLDYARISAPISGRIGKSSVTRGALVTANQATPLATIQQTDPMYVDLTQSSSELLAMRKSLAAGTSEEADLPVKIVLEDGAEYAYDGKLAFSEITVDPSTGSYLLRVEVPNPDHLLLPGMYVRAVVGSAVRQNGLLVPQKGITRDPKGNASAMVVGKDGKVEPRAVKVSRTVGDQWLVEDGLAAGDKVIVEGLQKVQPGAPVDATEAGTAEAGAEAPPTEGQPAGADPAAADPDATDNPDAAEPAAPAADADASKQ
ncbi:MAG: efflux RND transporter periplasmic adaptor subunit [Lysobacter sp.]